MTYESLLCDLVKNDDRYIILTAENRAAIRNLPDIVSKNFMDLGIAEQTMTGVAAGLALRGRIPVLHALATFLTMRAFEFIRTDVGIGNLPVKFVGCVPGFLSEANGPTHQAVEDIGLMRLIPNMEIFCPADEDDLLLSLKDVLASPRPAYIRYINTKPSLKHQTGLKYGEAEVIQSGYDITLFTYGIMLAEALKAKRILEEKGFSVGLVNLKYLNPFDEETVLANINSSYLNVCIEDHYSVGGLYSIIAEMLIRRRTSANIMSVSLNNKWFKPVLLKEVLEYEGFTGKQIADRILYVIKNELTAIIEK